MKVVRSQTAETIMAAMISGYGVNFPYKSADELMDAVQMTPADMVRLLEPFPSRGRYRNDTEFLKHVTSGAALGKKRFRLFAEKLIFMSRLMKNYKGKFSDKKIIPGLTADDEKKLLALGENINYNILAELLEKVTDQDTAAYADAFKVLIYQELPHLAEFIEAVHCGDTSDDNWANVVGLTFSELIYGHLITMYIDLCTMLLDYAEQHKKTMTWEGADMLAEEGHMFLLPNFTHWQTANATTHAKGVVTSVKQIVQVLFDLTDGGVFKPFSGKFGGLTGTFDAQFAMYPDIDWFNAGEHYVESLGLHFESMIHQSPSFAREAQIFRTLCTVNDQVLKFVNDFRFLVSCPGQMFVKKPKAGTKGSSSSPGKYNLWMCEGADKMLKKMSLLLNFLATELQDFTQSGDMGRSFLSRDIATDISYAFLAIPRIMKEVKSCVPNVRNIKRVFEEYPSICMSSMQYVLKRERFQGDAYREMQKRLFNGDGSYATRAEFLPRFEEFMESAGFTETLKTELRTHLDPVKLVKPIHERAMKELHELRGRLGKLQKIQQRTPSLKHYFEAQHNLI